ncbi:MAG: DUF4160 domain-containing protein [Dehalococcoidia bacterium]
MLPLTNQRSGSRGRLPPRALGLVIEWAALHRTELEDAWRKASDNEPLDPIEPLR